MGWVSLSINYADRITRFILLKPLIQNPSCAPKLKTSATWCCDLATKTPLGISPSSKTGPWWNTIARSHQRCALNNWSDKWQAHNLEWTMRIHSILDIFVNQVAELNDILWSNAKKKKTTGHVRAHITWCFPKTYSAVCQWIISASLDGDYSLYSPYKRKKASWSCDRCNRWNSW